LQASDEVFFPKYDDQKSVYLGIMNDLKEAVQVLTNVDASQYPINSSADIYYNGDSKKWLKFANALRMRYAMRLYHKRNDISEMNIAQEFSDASKNTFQSNDDNAEMEFIGTTEDNSAPGGSLRSANPNFGVKPSLTLVNALRNIDDPRLDRWVMPVQKKWDRSVQSETDITVVNSFGEEYEVTLMPTSLDNLDTSLYVGLPVGLPSIQAINFNIGSDQDAFDPEKNPHVSFLHPRYRVNREEFLNVKLMTFSEVNFLMAEAVLRGDM